LSKPKNINKPRPNKTSDNIAETDKKEPKLYQKTKDAITMVQAGMDETTALMYVNQKDKISQKQVSVLRSKVKKHSLTNPKIVKLANNAMLDCLRDKPINGDTYPSYTNKIAVASLVYDRYEPAVKVQVQASVSYSPVDLSKYLNADDAEYVDNKLVEAGSSG
jgi:hypothetical protein